MYSPQLSCREVDELFAGTTFGMEYDCGKFDRQRELPEGLGTWCTDEVAGHSICGIGVDPTQTYNLFGGEFQLFPTETEQALLSKLDTVMRLFIPSEQKGFPSTIHIHVRIPELLKHSKLLRYLIYYATKRWHEFTPYIYKWRDSDQSRYMTWLHMTMRQVMNDVYPQTSLDALERSDTTDPVEMAKILHNYPEDWKNEYASQDPEKVRRPAVNFGHLRDLGTIEFRCFMATTNRKILANIISFPLQFIRMALTGDSDPTRIVRGVVFQDSFDSKHNALHGATSRYVVGLNSYRQKIAAELLSKNITLADLNYPKFWIDKGF